MVLLSFAVPIFFDFYPNGKSERSKPNPLRNPGNSLQRGPFALTPKKTSESPGGFSLPGICACGQTDVPGKGNGRSAEQETPVRQRASSPNRRTVSPPHFSAWNGRRKEGPGILAVRSFFVPADDFYSRKPWPQPADRRNGRPAPRKPKSRPPGTVLSGMQRIRNLRIGSRLQKKTGSHTLSVGKSYRISLSA